MTLTTLKWKRKVVALNGSKMSKVAIITGASSGIGRALAIQGAKNGYNLSLFARNIAALTDLKAEIQEFSNVNILITQGDVSVQDDCLSLITNTIQEFGKINFLINNAGISMRSLFKDVDLNVIESLMNTNFWGTVYCTKYALPYLLESKGSVVGVSSIAGFKGLPARTGYSASKFAMQGFLESLRVENLKTGLHVLIACPGYTASNIRNTALNDKGQQQGDTPLDESKLMSAEVVALEIWKAIEKRKSYLILTLQGKMAVFLNKISSKLTDILTYNVIKKEPNSPFS